MALKFEANFEQLVKDAGCPQSFRDWLIKQHLLDAKDFGCVAATEAKLEMLIAAAKSDDVRF